MTTNFIETPNLPSTDVALVAASGTYPEIIQSLNDFGIETLQICPSKLLSTPVCCHADMLCHHLGGNQIIVAKGEEYLINNLKEYGFAITESNSKLESEYPQDIPINAARIGNHLFANMMLDSTIAEYCKSSRVDITYIRQGYTKCSIAVVDHNSIITADNCIADAARKLGIDVLKISPGFITLKGYDYGFIGGCCGLIGKNKIAFTGSLQSHPNYIQIRDFIENKQVEIIILTDENLVDIGGIIPLKEFL